MQLSGSRILLTGASGGIGRELAFELAAQGAELLLSGRRALVLDNIAQAIGNLGGRARFVSCDLSSASAAQRLIDSATADGARLDAIVNCAGISHFGLFESLSPEQLDALWRTNVLAPMQLAQAVLPSFKAQRHGLIVNVGSIFGSIGFPCFAAYSASKHALRGFSEALRRELRGTGVDVLYVAPRYTKTAINEGAVAAMAQAVAMPQDEPQAVARAIVDAMRANRKERFFGWPERFFVKLNAVLPRLVDRGLSKQAERMRPFALTSSASIS
jgi:short-subunit dehydrogenase